MTVKTSVTHISSTGVVCRRSDRRPVRSTVERDHCVNTLVVVELAGQVCAPHRVHLVEVCHAAVVGVQVVLERCCIHHTEAR